MELKNLDFVINPLAYGCSHCHHAHDMRQLTWNYAVMCKVSTMYVNCKLCEFGNDIHIIFCEFQESDLKIYYVKQLQYTYKSRSSENEMELQRLMVNTEFQLMTDQNIIYTKVNFCYDKIY